MMPIVIAAGLEAVLKRYLRLDPEILPRLAALEGTVIAIELEGVGLSFYLLPGINGLQVLEHYTAEPTVRIRGTPLALARWGRDGQVADGIVVEGDAAAGRAFQAILAQLDIDWEEQLSRVVGDVMAHQVGNVWRTIRGWGQRTTDTLLRDGGEYLQQELRALPPRHTVEPFLNAVDTLREDVDRLAARIGRLRRRLSADGWV